MGCINQSPKKKLKFFKIKITENSVKSSMKKKIIKSAQHFQESN